MIHYVELEVRVGEIDIASRQELDEFVAAVRKAVRDLHPKAITESAVEVEVTYTAGVAS